MVTLKIPGVVFIDRGPEIFTSLLSVYCIATVVCAGNPCSDTVRLSLKGDTRIGFGWAATAETDRAVKIDAG